MNIENNKACFVELWKKLEETYGDFRHQYRRFCPRRILQSWLGKEATEYFMWEVCHQSGLEGYQDLSDPALYPENNKFLLRALVATSLGIPMKQVNSTDLEKAYKTAFGKVFRWERI